MTRRPSLATVALVLMLAWLAVAITVGTLSVALGQDAAAPVAADPVADAVAQGAAANGIPPWAASLLLLLIPILRAWWLDRQAARALVLGTQRRRQAAIDRGDEDEARRIAAEAASDADAIGAGGALARAVRRDTTALDRNKIKPEAS